MYLHEFGAKSGECYDNQNVFTQYSDLIACKLNSLEYLKKAF